MLDIQSNVKNENTTKRTSPQLKGNYSDSLAGEDISDTLGKDIECMQILLIDVYGSQVGCRHLLSAQSGQTHAANPQA